MAVARYFVMGCKVVRRREEGILGEKFGRFMGRVFPSSSLREAENVGSPSSQVEDVIDFLVELPCR